MGRLGLPQRLPAQIQGVVFVLGGRDVAVQGGVEGAGCLGERLVRLGPLHVPHVRVLPVGFPVGGGGGHVPVLRHGGGPHLGGEVGQALGLVCGMLVGFPVPQVAGGGPVEFGRAPVDLPILGMEGAAFRIFRRMGLVGLRVGLHGLLVGRSGVLVGLRGLGPEGMEGGGGGLVGVDHGLLPGGLIGVDLDHLPAFGPGVRLDLGLGDLLDRLHELQGQFFVPAHGLGDLDHHGFGRDPVEDPFHHGLGEFDPFRGLVQAADLVPLGPRSLEGNGG